MHFGAHIISQICRNSGLKGLCFSVHRLTFLFLLFCRRKKKCIRYLAGSEDGDRSGSEDEDDGGSKVGSTTTDGDLESMMGSPGRMPSSTSTGEDNNNKMLASPHSHSAATASATPGRASPKIWRPTSSSTYSSASGSAASPGGGCPPGGLMVPVPVRAMPGQGLCPTPPPQLQRPDAANLLQPRDLPPHLGGVASTSSLAASSTVPAMIAT